jgi:hypothetical protein
MLQQHTRTTRGLGPVVALGLAIAAINPATGLAQPAGEPLAGTSHGTAAGMPAYPTPSVAQKSAISQDLVTPDARDAGGSGSAGTVSSQNLVSPDARDAGSVASRSQSLVSPDARDAADGVVVSSPKLAPAPSTSGGGIEGWDPEVFIGLGAALLMGLAGVGLLARARMHQHPRPRIS